MNPTEQQQPAAAPVNVDEGLLTQIIEKMEAANPYGMGKYTDEDAAGLGIESLGSLRLANQLVKAWRGSPMIPAWIQSSPNPAGTFVACVLRGKELGFKMLEAIQALYLSPDGRLGMYGTAMLALMRKSGIRIDFVTLKDEDGKEVGVQVHGKRGDGDEYTATFTLADALRAKLGRVHNVYPIWMCKWRAVSDLFRTLASDLSGGPLYSAEELSEDAREQGREIVDGMLNKAPNPYMQGLQDEAPAPAQDNPTQTTKQAGTKAEPKDEVVAQPVAATASGPATTEQPTSPAPPPEPKPAVVDDDPQSPANKEAFYIMLQAFAEQKKRLGEELYYQLLDRDGGVKKSTQFHSMALARNCYKIMLGTAPAPAEAAEPAAPKPAATYVDEIKAELAAISELHPKKSADAVKKMLDAYMKGFYGATKPKPDAANIGSIRVVLGLLRELVTTFPALVVESAAKATTTGSNVALGYRKCVAWLENRSPEAKAAFWRCAIARYADSGGEDALEYCNSVGLNSDLSDANFAAFMRVLARSPKVPPGVLIEQSRATRVPIHKIVEGWGIDVDTAPVAGIEALLKGGAAAQAAPEQPMLEPEPAQPEPPPAEEDEDTGWLTDMRE